MELIHLMFPLLYHRVLKFSELIHSPFFGSLRVRKFWLFFEISCKFEFWPITVQERKSSKN